MCAILFYYGNFNMKSCGWPKFLLDLANDMSLYCNLTGEDKFDCVNVNFYSDGSQHLNLHSDDEPLFGPKGTKKTILSLSFGANRWFQLKALADGLGVPCELHCAWLSPAVVGVERLPGPLARLPRLCFWCCSSLTGQAVHSCLVAPNQQACACPTTQPTPHTPRHPTREGPTRKAHAHVQGKPHLWIPCRPRRRR